MLATALAVGGRACQAFWRFFGIQVRLRDRCCGSCKVGRRDSEPAASLAFINAAFGVRRVEDVATEPYMT